jgi:TatA/E family protein of Tat protein translocase
MLSNPLLFFDISGGEFMVILIAVFLIFGPKKMPEIARKIGRTMNELKKASSDITREFREETNSIKNELLAARETVRRETESVTRQVEDTFHDAGHTIAKELPDEKAEFSKTEVNPGSSKESSSEP